MNPSLRRLALVVLAVVAGTAFTVRSYLESRAPAHAAEELTVEVAPAPPPVLPDCGRWAS